MLPFIVISIDAYTHKHSISSETAHEIHGHTYTHAETTHGDALMYMFRRRMQTVSVSLSSFRIFKPKNKKKTKKMKTSTIKQKLVTKYTQ